MTASAARSRPARARPAGRPRQAGRARSSRAGLILYVAGGSALSLAFLLPLAWAVARSFLPERLVTAAPSGQDVGHLTVSGYTGLLGGQIDILRNVLNSLVVAVGTSLLTAVVALLAGYGFARFSFRGSGLVFGLILATLMIPFQAVLTPLFLEMHTLRLTNSLLGLVLFYTTFNLPFGVFVMRNTFLQIRGNSARPPPWTEHRRCAPWSPCCGRSSCPASPPRSCTRSFSPGPSSSGR